MSKLPYEARLTADMVELLHRHQLNHESELILTTSLIASNGRLGAVVSAVENTADVPGHTAEIGCASGGTSLAISAVNGGRQHWACDTFDGLMDVGVNDDLNNKDFRSRRCTFEIVRERLARRQNATVVKGYFPDCATAEMISARYSFVHLDVDTYTSMLNAFQFFNGRMSPGGLMALDDVIGAGTRGAKKAWEEIGLMRKRRWKVVSENDPQTMIEFA